MKQKDIALILVIAFISAIFSFIISHFVFGGPDARQQQVEVVQPISASFTQPDTKYFNSDSINPTKLIQISENNNQTPFKSESQ